MSDSVSIQKPRRTRAAKKELESRTFKDGAIYLFRRADYVKPTWFCRVKVPNAKGYKSCSTKTTDEHAAYAFANNLFNALLIKVAGGQDINAKRVSQAIREYVENAERLPKMSSAMRVRVQFLTHITPFFGITRLPEVNTATLANLNDWIQQNSRRKALSPNTVKRYTTDLKQFLNWCVERGWLERLPQFPKLKAQANRRPHFEPGDWSKLTRHLREFVKVKDPNVARDRQMLVNYVLILANTGIRVGEARTLKWRDLREIPVVNENGGSATMALTVKGKTGTREVVARTMDVKTYFRRILELRIQELREMAKNDGETAKAKSAKLTVATDDYIFCSRDGKPIGSFKKSFSALLKAAGVETDSHGAKRTLYSLRHTYATFRLQEGVHQLTLAKNMGTSVAMLERHYGHTTNVTSAAELTKSGRFKGNKTTTAMDWLLE